MTDEVAPDGNVTDEVALEGNVRDEDEADTQLDNTMEEVALSVEEAVTI